MTYTVWVKTLDGIEYQYHMVLNMCIIADQLTCTLGHPLSLFATMSYPTRVSIQVRGNAQSAQPNSKTACPYNSNVCCPWIWVVCSLEFDNKLTTINEWVMLIQLFQIFQRIHSKQFSWIKQALYFDIVLICQLLLYYKAVIYFKIPTTMISLELVTRCWTRAVF